jgi:cytochrome c556
VQAHLLYYYIPTGRFRNPSATLRSRGYRVDGSVWVIPTDRLPWNLINRMKATPGVVCNEHKFDVEEASRLTATARAELSSQVLAATNAVQKKASTEYDPEKWETVEEFEKWLAGQVRTVARRAARMLADYAKAGGGIRAVGGRATD